MITEHKAHPPPTRVALEVLVPGACCTQGPLSPSMAPW